MKLAAWNVNSLNVRPPHLLDWLKAATPDVVCLQELKLEDVKFPLEAINDAGYNAVFDGQKTYNGVAILSKSRPEDVVKGIPGYADEQKRVIAATVDGVRVVCVYIPNGQSVDSGQVPLQAWWLNALTAYLKTEIAQHPSLAFAMGTTTLRRKIATCTTRPRGLGKYCARMQSERHSRA